MLTTGSLTMDADRAFTRARRERRRADILRRLGRGPAACRRLPVLDEGLQARAAELAGGVREIPLEAIRGTMEPSRAALFDSSFRPGPAARRRWERVWLAEQRGIVLPPISLVPTREGYAVRDGHHRVSVARARGAVTIDATVGTA